LAESGGICNTMAVSSLVFACSVSASLLSNCLTAAQHAVAFDSASATSAMPSGAFPAVDAISPGSGYWCSAGNHNPAERVTWTGAARIKQLATGVSINWAYGPGEYRILTSPDGGNFEEATGWRAAVRTETAYSESVLFDAPRPIKSLAVVMRSPKAWGYFGINDVSLMVQPGPSMLVAESATGAEELCFVADVSGVSVSSCLDAIARGSGQEVFTLSQNSQLVSAGTGRCVSAANGRVVLQDCEEAADAGDGRSMFALTSSSQLRAHSGYCLSATGAGASVVPCSTGQGEVALVAVPELNLAPAAQLKDVASLLRASEGRQRGLLQQFQSGLEACKGLVQGNRSAVAQMRQQRAPRYPTVEVSRKIDAAFGVDLAAVKSLITESSAALAAAQ